MSAIDELVSSLQFSNEVQNKIESCIGPYGDVLDSASSRLKSIRKQRVQTDAELHKEAQRFVSQNATVFEIEDIFEEDQKNKNRLEAVLITPSGKETEKPSQNALYKGFSYPMPGGLFCKSIMDLMYSIEAMAYY